MTLPTGKYGLTSVLYQKNTKVRVREEEGKHPLPLHPLELSKQSHQHKSVKLTYSFWWLLSAEVNTDHY